MYIMVRPRFDAVTQDTFDEAADVLAYMHARRVPVIDLADADAVRERVEAALRDHPDADVCHYDHGDATSWIGDDERACVDLETAHLLRGRAAYAQNCSSAKQLGVAAWNAGCEAYFGYTDLFIYTSDAKTEFKRFANEGIQRRVDGLAWTRCLETTRNLATELIDVLVKTGRAMAAVAMRWDRDHLHCWGDGIEEPAPACPVSRLIARLFGYPALRRLRRVRDALSGRT